MKAIIKSSAAKGAELAEVRKPEAGRGEVLIKVEAAALCKSDVDVYEWTELVQNAKYPTPFIMGHEFSGTVVEIGEDVRLVKKGDRVAGETHIPCGHCLPCRTGNQHICRNGMGVLGRTVDGCFAEYIKLPEIAVIPLPKALSFAEGALMEPMATAMHAVSKAKPAGRSVAVLGVGTIGQMAVSLAKFLGATKIFALDLNPQRLAESGRLGADVLINGREQDLADVILRETNGNGVQAIVDMTGNERVVNQAVEALAVDGDLIHVGMVEKPLTFRNYMYGVVYKELKVTGIFGRRMFETWEELMAILNTGRIPMNAFVGAEERLENFDQAVERFNDVPGRIVFSI